MDQKRGLPLRAMPPITYEGSRIRPIASTYNVMITLVYPFLVVQRTVAPPTRKGRNMETSLPFGSGSQFYWLGHVGDWSPST